MSATTTHDAEQVAAAARRLGRADDVVAGVLDLAGARRLGLDALLRLSAVEWCAEVRTACVECEDRPRLLLNPAFVAKRCTTRERLAMLVMHELMHVSLGHTRLYPRPTAAHNVAFDALINATILHELHCRGLDAIAYGALCTDAYAAGDPVAFILRPPPGWPHECEWEASRGADEALRTVHSRLYAAGHGHLQVTYGEILAALPRGADGAEVELLGSHGATAREASAVTGGRDARAADALAPALAALEPGAGRGRAGERAWLDIGRFERERALEAALRRLITRALVADGGSVRRWRDVPTPTTTVIPPRDRRAAVRRHAARLLGAPAPVLFHDETVTRRADRRAAAIYVDVSGSMGGHLERLHAALAPLRRLLAAKVFVFSTEVVELARAQWVAGRVRTTYGTDIEPVVRHLAALAAAGGPARALALTDGYVGTPSAESVRALLTAGGQLHLGVVGGGPLLEGERWVASSTRLPDLNITHTR